MQKKPRDFYEARAKGLLKELRESKKLSCRLLAARLQHYGVFMTDQVLINRINRGGFSFSFALMVMDALGAEFLEIPKDPALHPKTAKNGKVLG